VRRNERGNALIEFIFLGIPVIFITLSIIEASLAMWEFSSLSYTVSIATRFVVTHGRGCTKNGNTCSITVGNVANLLSSEAPALDPSKLNATLYTHATTTTCNPVNSCFSSTTQFPNSTDNGINLDVKIVATYPITNPLPMFWSGSGQVAGSGFTVSATSRQRILF
jgi:Flp pilus assembly protein TadG